jgi:hypothetical protein
LLLDAPPGRSVARPRSTNISWSRAWMSFRHSHVLSTATSAAGHLPARTNARQVQGEAGEPNQQKARRREYCAGGRARRVQQECDNEYYGCNYGEHPVPFRGYVIGASGGLVYLLGFGAWHVIFGFTPM